MRYPARRVLAQLCFLLLILPDILGFFGLTAREALLTLSPELDQNMRDLHQRKRFSHASLCNLLSLHRKQRRLCRRGRGVSETLVRATRLSVLECQHQFQYERWNCSLGRFRLNILDKGIKETSFLYAISSAGLVHEFARACSQGVLDRCTCDESKHLENTKTWLWGGCGDNIRFGLKFTRKFLRRARRAEKDIRARVDEHNSEAGVRIVKENVNTTCKCHGVSGSCTVQTCWLQLSPFHAVGRILKSRYENSAKVVSYANQATGKTQLMKRRHSVSLTSLPTNDVVPLRRSELVHIEESPSFCERSRYSPGTAGRACHKDSNCDSICCGRGYNVQRRKVRRACKCEVIWCCQVKCKECLSEEEIYLCK